MRATQLRPGMTIRHEGELYTVHSVEHRTPGNKRAAMATKMRNLRTGSIIDYRFRAEVDIERAIFDEIEHEYLYSDNDGYHFMNTESYEQFHLGADVLGRSGLLFDSEYHGEARVLRRQSDRSGSAGHDGPHRGGH
jgi:elongation factor P